VRRPNVDLLFRFGIHPAAEDAAAWKCESVHAVVTNDGQFEVAVERRGGYGLPLHSKIV
jgi:hypothetical protein